MKKYISFLLLTVLLISCKDTRYDTMIEDTVYISKSNLQEESIIVMNSNDYVYNIWIHKGGYYQNKFAGILSLDYSYLVEYNNDNDTNYKMLDEKYYSFERSFVMEKNVNETSIPMTLKIEQIISDLGYGPVYIPISVKSQTPNGEIYTDKSHFILALNLKQASLSIDSEWKGKQRKDFTTETNFLVDITAVMSAEAIEDFQVLYSKDLSLLEPGELELDPQYYTYSSNVALPKGERYAENYMTIKVDQMPDGEWVIPVRMAASNSKIGVADDAWLALTVKKGTLDDVVWGGIYLQSNTIVIGGSSQIGIEIGEFDNVTITVSSDEDWLRPSIVGDKIVFEVDENDEPGERQATVTVKNTENNLTKSIVVKQADLESGIPLDKSIWTIEAYSDNCADKASQMYKLYDGNWAKSGSDTSIEFNKRTVATDPYIVTFNLGADQTFNSFGLMPRQQWMWPAPKRVKIEVSEDNIVWTAVGKDMDGEGIMAGFTSAEVDSANHYNGKIHWFDFQQAVKARYVRLYLYESFHSTGTVCCLDEVFASLK